MKKVFLIHGLGGPPNGGWRPWLMRELDKTKVYACALPMPNPETPVYTQWIGEIARAVEREKGTDEIFLVGHSLGSATILRYLEQAPEGLCVGGVVLTACPIHDIGLRGLDDFLGHPFDFARIRRRSASFTVIHGDDDDVVPFEQALELAGALDTELVIVPGGCHLTGSDGWHELPEALAALKRMFG